MYDLKAEITAPGGKTVQLLCQQGKVSVQDPDLSKWEDRFAEFTPVWYGLRGQKVTFLSSKEQEGLRQGFLLRPGKMAKQNHLYLFCAPEPGAVPRILSASDQDILDYQNDYELRKNSLAGTDSRHTMSKEFWALPKPGQTKPMFWLEADGHLVLGMSQYLRTTFRYRLSEFLPERQKEQMSRMLLDYPNAILGYIDADTKTAYRSRIRVSDFSAPAGTRPGREQRAILAQPKATFFGGYACLVREKEENSSSAPADYNDSDSNGHTQLRGYKQYWLKQQESFSPTDSGKGNVLSVLRPLPKGTRFTGTIRYQNLHEDELGLLLWALLLDEGCFQSIGMGKALGLGRMRVQLDALIEEDSALYTRLDASAVPAADPQSRARELIRAYETYVSGELARSSATSRKKGNKKPPSLRSNPSVKGLLYLRRTVVENRYPYRNMELERFRKAELPLPLLQEFQKQENDRKTQPAALATKPARPSRATGRGGYGQGLSALAGLLSEDSSE